MLFLRAPVADVRRAFQAEALLFLEILAGLITDFAGAAGALTDLYLIADIRSFATEAPSAEVMRIVESPAWLDIIHSVKLDLFRDRCWVLAKESRNVFERHAFFKAGFDVLPVV